MRDPAELAAMLEARYAGAFLKDIARPRGLTPERVRQILAKADPEHTARSREARRRRQTSDDAED